MILAAATFVLVLAIVAGSYYAFVLRPERRLHRTINSRLKTVPRRAGARAELLKQARRLSTVPAVDALLSRARSTLQPVERLLAESGAQMTVATLLLLCACTGAAIGLAIFSVTRIAPLALGAGSAAAWLPVAWLRAKRSRRLLKFEEQFPESLDLLSRALKAGHALTTGISMVADEMPEPVGPEFRLMYDQQNYGMPLPEAMRAFAARVPVLDARFFVTAVLTQRESGGNLSEILENLATVIRDRFRVKRQVRVISAHGRLTGLVLTGVPPALAAVLFLINPNHWRTLTGSSLGVKLIVAAVVLQITGGLIIRKLVRIEY